MMLMIRDPGSQPYVTKQMSDGSGPTTTLKLPPELRRILPRPATCVCLLPNWQEIVKAAPVSVNTPDDGRPHRVGGVTLHFCDDRLHIMTERDTDEWWEMEELREWRRRNPKATWRDIEEWQRRRRRTSTRLTSHASGSDHNRHRAR